jgi:hypothetical protein
MWTNTSDLMHNIFYAYNAILPQCLQAKDKAKRALKAMAKKDVQSHSSIQQGTSYTCSIMLLSVRGTR